MRICVLIPFLFFLLFLEQPDSCFGGGRLGRVQPGMTRTDVAIELGKPADVRVEREVTLWIYPSSENEICTIKFVKQKVADTVQCDSSESVREFAKNYASMLPKMNSDIEYAGRVQRYCGLKPKPKPGCHISEQCLNGEWGEICN
jgi:hypothetical protein